MAMCLINKNTLVLEMVMAAGFEPATHSLEGCCSIQLSYATLRVFSSKTKKLMNLYRYSKANNDSKE